MVYIMDLAESFAEIVGEDNVRTDLVERACYSRDMSVHEGVPEAVVFARTTEQISRILKKANKGRIPVIARGSGTSVTGAVLAFRNRGIVLDLSRMNRIKEINRENGYAVVEPGVICSQLNAALEPTHFFPPEPSSAMLASIGGMVSTNASGERALKYGTTKNYLMALEVVLADGKILRTGAKTPKSSVGYSLTHLFCQSEGTLGLITEITVKIIPVPSYIAFGQANFPSVEDAGLAAEQILKGGLPLSSCEILDRTSIDVAVKTMGLEIPDEVGCMMFLEIDGQRDSVIGRIEEIDRICTANKGLGNEWSDDPAKRAEMWAARQGLVSSLSKVKRGTRLIPLVEDFGVPINKIPDTIRAIQAIGEKHDFPMSIFGHVGDGNLHAVILLDPRNRGAWEKARKISDDLIDLTLRFDGTLSAEHGVGMAKSPYIREELDVGAEVMQKIKMSLDPNNILNPGKMGMDHSVNDIYEQFAFEEFSKEPSRIQSFGKEIDDEILACIQCGFCRLGCPTYKETSLESFNARGRVILAYNLLTGKLEPSDEMAKRFYDCTTCLNCRSTCPAEIEVAAIVGACRKRLADKGYLPDCFKPMLESLRSHGNPFGEPAEKRTEIFPEGLKKAEGDLDVLLFMGCMPSYQDIRIAPALTKIMERVKHRYGVLGELERCCGYIAHLVGGESDFMALMDENLDRFSKHGSPIIVTTCAGCHKTFKELYPRFARGSVPEAVHFVEYIDRLIQEGEISFQGSFEKKVIYHDPCDLGRHLGIYEPPRRILQAIPGLDPIEFQQNRALAHCCGGGGGMKAFDDPLSDAIAYKRVIQAVESGAEVIVSACPSCKRNLQLGASRLRKEKKGRVQVMDITEVMAKCL